jgi:hypothetical protein
LIAWLPAVAQAPAAPAAAPTVKGTMKIDFKSRVQVTDAGVPQAEIVDTYLVDLTVADSLLFQGSIAYLPPIFSSVLGRETQASKLDYKLDLSIRNPSNLSEVKRVGRMVGGVPIDRNGVYDYGKGTLRIAVDAMGKASGFESQFSGQAAGKPPKVGSVLEKAKKQALTLTRSVNGKTVKLVVTDYDKMALSSLLLGAGPVRTYPETTVNGELLYDYERGAWYCNGVTMSYQLDGKAVTDKLSGNIKWVESPDRKSNGEGEYQFDVRVNEPEVKQGEAAVFAAPDDESAFFASDSTVPSLTGKAKYKDTIRGETVAASTVAVDLVGNNLTKQQVVNLTKLLWFVSVVPMNSE